jgi:MtrB/PioB family decaheme-associated outer membrane protein
MNQPRRVLVLAVQSALALMGTVATGTAVHAADADPAVTELTQPASTVEVGVGNVNHYSAKAAEYNGVSGKGLYGIFDADLRGGAAYDSDSALRWRLNLRNLGLDNRSAAFEIGEQGRYRVDLGFDELRRQRSDTYRTPYLGAGTNTLTLPSTWLVPLVPRVNGTAPALGVAGGANARGLSPAVTSSSALVSGVLTAPTPAQLSTANAIQAADLPLFQSVDLSTKRTRYGIGLSYEIDRRWQANASLTHENRVGLKPMGTVTRYTNADLSATIPDLIDQSTEQVNLGLTYLGDGLTLNAAYYGSAFVNHVPSMSWANWAFPGNVQTMSTAPDNQFHQFSLNGNAVLVPGTRLSASLSYGRSTQNEAFLTDSGTPLVPVASLQGLVVTQGATLKLSSRLAKDLQAVLAYRFDERDNRTPVNTYGFYDAGEAKTGTSLFTAAFPAAALGANANINANRPYSRRSNQVSADADYALAPAQAFKAGADWQRTAHYCTGSWVACADASDIDETTVRGEWRLNTADGLGARIGLSAAQRKVDYNEDAFLSLVPAANLSPTGAPGGSTAYGTLTALGFTGYGPVSGLNPLPTAGSAQAFFFANNNALSNSLYGNQNRISELPGLRRYNMADRHRDKLRTAVSYDAPETWSLQMGFDVNEDRYTHSVYGLTSARSWVLNLEAGYKPTEDVAVNVYYSTEDQRSQSAGNSYTANSTATAVNGFTAVSGGCFATIALRNASNKVDPCLDWRADMHDQVDTLGLSFTVKNLLRGSLDLAGGASYSQARSVTDVVGGNYANNPLAVTGAAPGTVAAFYIPAAALPAVTTETIELHLSARYALSKVNAVRVGYGWQHAKVVDWAYDGLQPGGLSGVLPTYEQAPSYNVHTIGVAYIHTFR